MAGTINSNGTITAKVLAGRRYTFRVAGDFGGGTVTLQWSDGTNDVDFPDGAFTADGAAEIVTPSPLVKIVTSGAALPDLLYNLTMILDGPASYGGCL